ncbi:MAG: RND transporter [Rhodobacteraceae bacterium]|nr:RND transporter [Paracoccaceae bacterium]
MAISLKKIALWTVGAAAIGAGLYYSFLEQPVPVDVAQITAGPMEVTIDADGVTRIRNVFEVSSPVSGTALRSPVEVGDTVSAGETVVAIIEPSQPVFLDARSRLQAEAAVKEAEAALRLSELNIAAAEASYEYARDQYDRAKILSDSGTLSANALDEVELLLEQARTALVSALSERTLRLSSLERTKAMLVEPDTGEGALESCCIEILAPIDGSVLSVASSSERAVMAGGPLVSIGLVDDLELVVDLLSTDVVNLSEGAAAYVERWGGDGTLLAEIARIEPSAFTKISALGIAEQRVRVVLDINSAEEEYAALGDGFRVFIRVIEWRSDDAVQLPISALFRDGGSWMVFKIVDGIASSVPVEIGNRNASTAEVLGGIAIGDTVITHPSDRISDGVLTVNRNDL